MHPKLRKAVFPVAGLGSRFLPVTKASPKEMLPIVDKPLIQYAVEEAAAAGITEMVFVTGRNKRAIEDHFDKAYELETELERKNKGALLDMVRSVLPEGVRCMYVRQAEPLGLGHAVLCAQPIVGDEAFAVLLADDLIDAHPPAMCRMAEIFVETGASLLGVEEVPRSQTQSYGIVTVDKMQGDTARIHSIVEKPKPAQAPSNLGVIGRYVLTPRIFAMLADLAPGSGGELQLTDAMARMMKVEGFVGYEFTGDRYDAGDKLGFLKATVEFALRRYDLGGPFRIDVDDGDQIHAVAVCALRRRPADAAFGVDAKLVRLHVPGALAFELGGNACRAAQQFLPCRCLDDGGLDRFEPALHAAVQGVVGQRLPVGAVRRGRDAALLDYEAGVAAAPVVPAVLEVEIGRQQRPVLAQRLQIGQAFPGLLGVRLVGLDESQVRLAGDRIDGNADQAFD